MARCVALGVLFALAQLHERVVPGDPCRDAQHQDRKDDQRDGEGREEAEREVVARGDALRRQKVDVEVEHAQLKGRPGG